MTLVDVDSWRFEFRHDSQVDVALGTARAPEIFQFASASALAKFLSNDATDDFIRIHGAIDDQLKAKEEVKALKRDRTLLRSLHHFPKYRRRKYDDYHRAARAISTNSASPEQHTMATGLDAEISGSPIVLEPGQVLFHGRCDDQLVTQQPYPSFISTTLNPVVARNSAFRRTGANNANGRPVVFVLTLGISLNALWGHVGRSAEWELLLPRNIKWRQTGRSTGIKFDVVQAEAF